LGEWNGQQSEDLYNVPNWGAGFFSVNAAGHVQVRPDGQPEEGDTDAPAIDLCDLIDQIRRRGVATPLLLRFDGVLRSRVRQIHRAFDRAREEFGYPAPYRGVYPIKVNQERWVVSALLEEGRSHGMGLEVGSKPELIAGVALQAGEDSLLVCNGYKDLEYVELALLSSQVGITALIVIEKATELDTILEAAARLNVRPRLGVRVKLSARGSGRWQESGGDRSKFGLTSREIVGVVETLRAHEMLDCLELLHFHVGSQISHIRTLKMAMREATQVLAGLHDLGVKIRWFDAGGGLGIDYDGSKSTGDSSRNYSLQEYANDVVWNLVEACRDHDLEPPVIITESGRALTAHHSVLVAEVLGVSSFQGTCLTTDLHEEDPEVVRNLAELCEELAPENYLESYHDALEQREKGMALFNTGQLSLVHRARVEEFFWRACESVLAITRGLEHVPDELSQLERQLSDTYFVNASIFQSIPDAWAIGQLFPVMPLQRLDEEPNRRAVIADLTCDSDGKLDQFIGRSGPKDTLEVHNLREGEPYFLGFFLVGAYQEILGDMHNLFGDTNVVHVDVDVQGRPRLVNVQRGDQVKEVLAYVEYFEEDLLRSLRRHVEDALDAGRMSLDESARFFARYEAGLHGYTYLARGAVPTPAPQAGSSNSDTTGLSPQHTEEAIEDFERHPG